MPSTDDEGELDRIQGGVESDELVTPTTRRLARIIGRRTGSHRRCCQRGGLAPRDGRTRDLRGGGPCQGLSLSFSDACTTAPRIVTAARWS